MYVAVLLVMSWWWGVTPNVWYLSDRTAEAGKYQLMVVAEYPSNGGDFTGDNFEDYVDAAGPLYDLGLIEPAIVGGSIGEMNFLAASEDQLFIFQTFPGPASNVQIHNIDLLDIQVQADNITIEANEVYTVTSPVPGVIKCADTWSSTDLLLLIDDVIPVVAFLDSGIPDLMNFTGSANVTTTTALLSWVNHACASYDGSQLYALVNYNESIYFVILNDLGEVQFFDQDLSSIHGPPENGDALSFYAGPSYFVFALDNNIYVVSFDRNSTQITDVLTITPQYFRFTFLDATAILRSMVFIPELEMVQAIYLRALEPDLTLYALVNLPIFSYSGFDYSLHVREIPIDSAINDTLFRGQSSMCMPDSFLIIDTEVNTFCGACMCDVYPGQNGQCYDPDNLKYGSSGLPECVCRTGYHSPYCSATVSPSLVVHPKDSIVPSLLTEGELRFSEEEIEVGFATFTSDDLQTDASRIHTWRNSVEFFKAFWSVLVYFPCTPGESGGVSFTAEHGVEGFDGMEASGYDLPGTALLPPPLLLFGVSAGSTIFDMFSSEEFSMEIETEISMRYLVYHLPFSDANENCSNSDCPLFFWLHFYS